MVAIRFIAITCICFAIAAAAAPRHAAAQFGGDDSGDGGPGRGGRGGFGGPGGRFGGPGGGGPGGGFGGPGGRGFDPAAMAGRWDQDEDGEIAPDEIPEFMRERFADQIREAGKDPDEPIPVDEFGEIMRAGFERMREQGGPGGPGGFRGRGGPPGQDGEGGPGPGGPGEGRRGRGRGGRGRGGDEQQPEAPQRPAAVNDFADSGSGSGGRPQPQSSGSDDQAKEIAQRLLDRVDENKDGILQEDEWRGYRLNNLEPADASGDKTITLEELTNWTAETRRRVARENGDEGGGSSGRSRAAASTVSEGSSNGHSSYRASTVRDRLPSGLPPWFMQRDADGDGQVMMHEWTRSWTNAELASFNGNDANGDGVITPAEAIAAGR